jgi:hypothetical protein
MGDARRARPSLAVRAYPVSAYYRLQGVPADYESGQRCGWVGPDLGRLR